MYFWYNIITKDYCKILCIRMARNS